MSHTYQDLAGRIMGHWQKDAHIKKPSIVFADMAESAALTSIALLGRPRLVETLPDLRALPEGTVLLLRGGVLGRLSSHRMWIHDHATSWWLSVADPALARWLPAKVVYTPKEGRQ